MAFDEFGIDINDIQNYFSIIVFTSPTIALLCAMHLFSLDSRLRHSFFP
jgi:hypothetical protein